MFLWYFIINPENVDFFQNCWRFHDEVHKEAHDWFGRLPNGPKTRIMQHFGNFPEREPDILASPNGPAWVWWELAVLPLDPQSAIGTTCHDLPQGQIIRYSTGITVCETTFCWPTMTSTIKVLASSSGACGLWAQFVTSVAGQWGTCLPRSLNITQSLTFQDLKNEESCTLQSHPHEFHSCFG